MDAASWREPSGGDWTELRRREEGRRGWGTAAMGWRRRRWWVGFQKNEEDVFVRGVELSLGEKT
jgi:hypothetical protein